jgi:hypothetical protein
MRHFLGIAAIVIANAMPMSSVLARLSDRLPPAAYVDSVDQKIARTGKGIPGRPFPCAREKKEQGITVIESVPTDKCVRMLPTRRWQGLWRHEFEGSRFCAVPATACDYNSKGDKVWLTYDPVRGKWGALYSVDFIGRKTMYKGPYGHLGMSDHEIIVDRVMSIKMVQAPPPPMAKDQLIEAMKRCEAAQTCIPSAEMRSMMNSRK